MPEKCEATPGCVNVGWQRDRFGVMWCAECVMDYAASGRGSLR